MNKKFLYTLILLALGLGLAFLLAKSKPEREVLVQERLLRSVRAMTVEASAEHLLIGSQGSVQPRSQTELIPEVSGRVEWMSPSLVGGGSFRQGDVLLRINNEDYQTALRRAQAASDRTQVEMEYSRDERERMEKLFAQKLASQSQLDSARRAARVAEANLSDSEAALAQARRDLARTELTAPFDGLVRSEQVDLGQFISRGTSIATIYATDYVEVRLPIANAQLGYLGLAINHRGTIPEESRPDVSISAEFGTTRFIWSGKLVRTEAEIDERSRMIYGVARIQLEESADSPIIPVGLFVHAEIQGRKVDSVVRLPRSAMRDNDQVLVIDSEDRLRFRRVTVLRLEHDEVLVSEGLADGERVCVSAIQTVVDGMHVKPLLQ
jgi:RND family efflux transporter MFP subunit